MKGRTALITGASTGIGKAIAGLFARNGAVLLTPSRIELNLSDNSSIDRYLAGIGKKADILVNNAGINPLGRAEDFSDADCERIMQVNLIAPMRLLRALLPGMCNSKYGRVVNISSIWSRVSKPGRFTYSTVKSAINGMTRASAVEAAPSNVLINAVAPGYVNTELTRRNNSEAELRAISEGIPERRLAEPAEIAELVAFLASEKNTYITGQTIFIDGGYSCI